MVTGFASFHIRFSTAPLFGTSLRKRLFEKISEWRRRRRERRELANLSIHDLKDLGYPADAAAEQMKLFWKV